MPDRILRLFLPLLFVLAANAARADLYEDFIIAVNNDQAAKVKEFLARGVDPNTVGPNGEPALVLAARAGYTATVDALLDAKANVNARSAVGDSAIMAAALNGRLDIVKKLRSRGAEINNSGWTPLIYAATGGHDAIVEYLLAEGASINAVSPNGTSALMMAVREGKGSTVTLLIAKGADVNQRNQSGGTALAWAMRGNEQAMASALRRAGAKE
jgi:ankyrin repeat protein